MLYLFIYQIICETNEIFVDDYGVEYEDSSKTNLTGTSSVVVNYVVPSSCVIINGGVTPDDSSFRSCNKTIKTLEFEPDSKLTCIYPFVFSGTYIEHINFTNCKDLLSINSSICRYCSHLISVILPPYCTYIGEYAFRDCISLKGISIPDSVTSIGIYAFSQCSSINEVNISENSKLKSFGSDCFSFINVSTFYIPKDFTTYSGASLFNTHIFNFIIHPDNDCFSTDNDGLGLFNKDKTIIYYIPKGKYGTYTLPNTVKKVIASSLRSTNFSYIKLTENVTIIEDWSLGNNYNLQEFIFPSLITEIRPRVLKMCDNLRRIVIKGEVTIIKDGAFSLCPKLEEIILPNSLKTLDYQVFYADTSLKTLKLPPNLESISYGCFALCPLLEISSTGNSHIKINAENLLLLSSDTVVNSYFGKEANAHITIPSTVTTIDQYAFQNTNIEQITFERASCKAINSYAFSDSSIKIIEFPTSLTSIGNNAFENCINIEEIDLSNTQITSISNYCFYNCSSLSIFTVPLNKKLKTIGEYSFAETSDLHEFKFEDTGIESIGARAFQNSGINNIIFPNTLKSLGVSSFEGSLIVNLNFGDSQITNIPWLCFSNCVQLTTLILTDEISTIDEESFSNCICLQGFKLPQNIQVIESKAFYGCLELHNVTFPINCNLEIIKGQAFAKCPSLTSFTLQEGESNFSCIDGVLLNKKQTKIYVYLPSSPNKIYVVPSKVTQINGYAFQQCNNLKTVIIPDGTLTNIGLYAFESCEQLQYLYLPNTLETVGIRAFANCNKLKCGGVIVNPKLRSLVISRGISNSVFNEYCPSDTITCNNANKQWRGILTAIFINLLF